MARHARRRLVDLRRADRRRDVVPVDPDAPALDVDRRALAERGDRRFVGEIERRRGAPSTRARDTSRPCRRAGSRAASAIARATVPLPAPDGPSIAMMRGFVTTAGNFIMCAPSALPRGSARLLDPSPPRRACGSWGAVYVTAFVLSALVARSRNSSVRCRLDVPVARRWPPSARRGVAMSSADRRLPPFVRRGCAAVPPRPGSPSIVELAVRAGSRRGRHRGFAA